MNHDIAKQEVHRAYTARTENDLRQLAMDYADGKIFTSTQIQPLNVETLVCVFLPLAFLQDAGAWFEDVAFLFEYYDRAMNVTINGYPTFASAQRISKGDALIFSTYLFKYRAAKAQFMAEPPPETIP